MEEIAIIAYGDGKELGDFKIFASHLESELSKKYKTVIVKYVNRDFQFFQLLNSIDESKQVIAELHVFSHAIGAGLFLGYGDSAISMNRNLLVGNKMKSGSRVTYLEAVNTEKGAIQTDDLVSGKYLKNKAVYQSKFSAKAFLKLWGCNSGVKNWVYSDGNGVVDPKDKSVLYYWRAFNEFNVPKPSIASAMAKFFNRSVYGASSGASIEVKYKKTWISSKEFKTKVGHWPSGALPHRLTPDIGKYNEYLP